MLEQFPNKSATIFVCLRLPGRRKGKAGGGGGGGVHGVTYLKDVGLLTDTYLPPHGRNVSPGRKSLHTCIMMGPRVLGLEQVVAMS